MSVRRGTFLISAKGARGILEALALADESIFALAKQRLSNGYLKAPYGFAFCNDS